MNTTDDTVYEHNTVNEMTKEDTSTLAYDANGNFEGASNAYKYNWQNQLETYTVGPATFTWHHDAFGRTVQRDRTSSTASNRKYFDGVNVIESVSFESTTGVETHKKTWVYGERPDEMLLYVDVAATPDDEYYAHADRLGSVMLLVDDAGAIQESYRYTEWGEHTIVDDTFTALSFGTNSPVGNAVLYTGQRWARTAEGSTGGSGMTWYDYKARHYRADAGRFVQRDPLGYVDGAGLYNYVSSDPLNFTDPTGTTLIGGGGGGGGGDTPVTYPGYARSPTAIGYLAGKRLFQVAVEIATECNTETCACTFAGQPEVVQVGISGIKPSCEVKNATYKQIECTPGLAGCDSTLGQEATVKFRCCLEYPFMFGLIDIPLWCTTATTTVKSCP